MSHDYREAIAEVLALAVCRCEHDAEEHSNYGGGCLHLDCLCPYNATTVRADALLGSDVLAQIRAEARAEALREAADDWQQGAWTELTAAIRPGGPGSIIGAGQVVTDWLRARVEGSA